MKKQLLLPLLLGVAGTLFSGQSAAQGCVAIRPLGGCSGASASGLLGEKQWQIGTNYRWFRSFRHFKSDSEQHERLEQNTEVINKTHFFDLGITYGLSDRLSLAVNLPLIFNDRSSLYEHYGNLPNANPEHKRFHTGSQGIGDLRLSASYWLLRPEKVQRHNLAVGLGVKLPTGNENVQDEFHKRKTSDGADSIIVKAVDQSIQLGDGGWGLSFELQGYARLFKNASLYFNGFYLLTPQETNNTVSRVLNSNSTARDSITAFHSVADQFVVRLGLNYVILPEKGLVAGLGFRAEGIPAKDIIGGDKGFRRPGYIISVEPGLTYQFGPVLLSASVPYALYRNRVKSVSDLADPAGLAHGDAAFADYAVNAGVAWRFGGKKAARMDHVRDFQDVTH